MKSLTIIQFFILHRDRTVNIIHKGRRTFIGNILPDQGEATVTALVPDEVSCRSNAVEKNISFSTIENRSLRLTLPAAAVIGIFIPVDKDE